jgi:hypothetical protein
MAEKKSGFNKTKQKVSEVLNQAKESLKILETLEKETLAKAKSFVKMPKLSKKRKQLTNDRILQSLKKIGVATHSEVQALEKRIHQLELAITSQTQTKEPHKGPHSVETH